MDTQLIRKIIRMIAFQASLDSEGQTQLSSVISARSHKLVSNTQVTMIRDEWWNLDINKTEIFEFIVDKIPLAAKKLKCLSVIFDAGAHRVSSVFQTLNFKTDF